MDVDDERSSRYSAGPEGKLAENQLLVRSSIDSLLVDCHGPMSSSDSIAYRVDIHEPSPDPTSRKSVTRRV